MPIPMFVVDAFADRAFAGNPAAVCLLDGPRPESWMQGVASEMNLSETAFLLDEGGDWRLRWFTPKVEVELCGHATLASAHVLWELGRGAGEALRFETRGGSLFARREADGRSALDFPLVAVAEDAPPAGLLEALGARALFAGRNRMDWLVEVKNEAALRALRPDFAALEKMDARGVIATARSASAGFDFVSRFFAPRAGVNEDPVTGSAHCALAPYWGAKLGKDEMTAFQASARGGVLGLRLRGERVELLGRALTVLRGELAS